MLTDLPIYKHPIRPGTDEATVAAILASPEFFLCRAYNCRMSREACGRRRAAAMEAEESDKKIVFSKCIECQQAERGKIMDPKKCPVDGCGKPVKARGMCMTHYYREYSKGKFSTKRTPADPPDPAPPPEPEKKTDPPKIPTTPRDKTKRVNVQFTGPDVALWEMLKAQAKKNRRDIRTEALFIIEQSLTVGPGVYS